MPDDSMSLNDMQSFLTSPKSVNYAVNQEQSSGQDSKILQTYISKQLLEKLNEYKELIILCNKRISLESEAFNENESRIICLGRIDNDYFKLQTKCKNEKEKEIVIGFLADSIGQLNQNHQQILQTLDQFNLFVRNS